MKVSITIRKTTVGYYAHTSWPGRPGDTCEEAPLPAVAAYVGKMVSDAVRQGWDVEVTRIGD